MRPQSFHNRHNRRQFLRGLACSGLSLLGLSSALSACAPASSRGDAKADPQGQPSENDAPRTYALPTADGQWRVPTSHRGDLPAGRGSVHIAGSGALSFEAGEVQTLRPDIFATGHISLFDVLAHLGERGDIDLSHHWDAEMDTHVIDQIEGRENWWYDAYYAAGWSESNVFRMDMYPYKNGTTLRLEPAAPQRLTQIYDTFRQEVARRDQAGGRVIIPELAIRSPAGNWAFEKVEVTPYDVRGDLFQPGVVTALDALLSLAQQGHLSGLELTWYERIGSAEPVDSYWVSQINDATAQGGCGFVYEIGPRAFSGFRGAHIHIPADARAIVSPEYALWFWICL